MGNENVLFKITILDKDSMIFFRKSGRVSVVEVLTQYLYQFAMRLINRLVFQDALWSEDWQIQRNIDPANNLGQIPADGMALLKAVTREPVDQQEALSSRAILPGGHSRQSS